MIRCRMKIRHIAAFFLVLGLSSAGAIDIRYRPVSQETVRQRLEQYVGKNPQREQTLKKLFSEAGCAADRLTEQKVKHEDAPNVICILPGETQDEIVVGAHFDRVARGDGVVDNWSGASLLPSLLEALRSEPRRHTLIFIGFTAEEQGMIGSQFYVKSLSHEQRVHIHAMVNLDTLGLGPTEAWVSHADRLLVRALATVAHGVQEPVSGMNVERVGSTDSESFREAKIPAITLHTLTQRTLSILHSSDDRIKEIKFNDYYDSYKLVAAYLAYLDQLLPEAAEKK